MTKTKKVKPKRIYSKGGNLIGRITINHYKGKAYSIIITGWVDAMAVTLSEEEFKEMIDYLSNYIKEKGKCV